jgi:hypothetical protein
MQLKILNEGLIVILRIYFSLKKKEKKLEIENEKEFKETLKNTESKILKLLNQLIDYSTIENCDIFILQKASFFYYLKQYDKAFFELRKIRFFFTNKTVLALTVCCLKNLRCYNIAIKIAENYFSLKKEDKKFNEFHLYKNFIIEDDENIKFGIKKDITREEDKDLFFFRGLFSKEDIEIEKLKKLEKEDVTFFGTNAIPCKFYITPSNDVSKNKKIWEQIQSQGNKIEIKKTSKENEIHSFGIFAKEDIEEGEKFFQEEHIVSSNLRKDFCGYCCKKIIHKNFSCTCNCGSEKYCSYDCKRLDSKIHNS